MQLIMPGPVLQDGSGGGGYIE